MDNQTRLLIKTSMFKIIVASCHIKKEAPGCLNRTIEFHIVLHIKDMFFWMQICLLETYFIRRPLVHGAVCCWKRGKVSAGRTTWFIKWAALGLYFMVLTLRHLQKLRSRFQHFPTLPPLCNPALISDKTCGHLHWLTSHTHTTFS